MSGTGIVIEVRYFASLAERAGCASERVELPPGADVAALWRVLETRHAGLAGLGYRPAAACDRAYASWDRDLQGVREVAFLPPVSGG